VIELRSQSLMPLDCRGWTECVRACSAIGEAKPHALWRAIAYIEWLCLP